MSPGRRSAIAVLTSSSLAQAVSSSLSAVLASSLLGPHDRGLMVLGTTSGSIAALVAGMGTGSSLRSRLPRLTGPAPRERLLASYTWWSILAALAAGGLAMLLSVGMAPLIDPGLADPRFLGAVLVVTIGYAALTQFPDVWYAAGGFRAGSAWAAATAAGGLAGVLGGALVERDPGVLLLGQGLGMAVVTVVQSARLYTAGLLSLRPPARPELAYLLRFGAQALGLTVGLALALRADRYLLGAFAGATAVGIYSVAATLSETPRLLPAALGQLVNREVALGRERVRLGRSGLLALASAASVGLLVAAGGWLLIVPVFGAAFADARPLLLVLLAAEVLFAPFAVASRGLLGGGWMGTAGALGMLGSVAAIALYAAAVPVWGAYGTAAACVLSYAALSAASWLLLRRRLASASYQVAARPLPRPAARV